MTSPVTRKPTFDQVFAGWRTQAQSDASQNSAGARASDPKAASEFFRKAGFLWRDHVDDAVSAVRAFRRALTADPDDMESLAGSKELCFARFRSTLLHEGFFEEDGVIWAADGTVLAQSRQLAILMPLGGKDDAPFAPAGGRIG